MRLTHLSLTEFRNFSRLNSDFPAGPIMLTGANAQGKTSLLEAIFYLAALAPFHAESDRQLINFLEARKPQAVTRLVGEFLRGEAKHRIEVRLIQESTVTNGISIRKEILVDGVKRKAHEAVGRFNAVLFLPQSCEIIEGAPDERRRYLNLAISQIIAHYPAALADYTKAVTQRNALLKLLNERGGDAGQLDYWDHEVSQFGGQIIAARIAAIQEIERLAARVHQELTHSAEILRISYQPAYDPIHKPARQMALSIQTGVDRSGLSVEHIQKGFAEQLARQRREEIARGVTTIGPHRDELRFLSNGIDLGSYGSRGQVRTAILSIKLAEADWMHEKTGQWPVLLLDEVMAELDHQRRDDLLSKLGSLEQVLLTTTDFQLFSAEFLEKAAAFHIEAGRLTPGGRGSL